MPICNCPACSGAEPPEVTVMLCRFCGAEHDNDDRHIEGMCIEEDNHV